MLTDDQGRRCAMTRMTIAVRDAALTGARRRGVIGASGGICPLSGTCA